MRLLLILLTLLPGIGNAANLFDPVADDKSMQILGALFGKLGVFGSSSSDSFSSVLSMFNGAALTIGGLLVAYTILSGTINTAHDGEMLGKRFSSIWVPIRTALGAAAVLPIINGYCLMQLLVGWAIVQGVGLADNVWGTYMSSSNISKQITASIDSPSVKGMAWKTFASLACTRSYEKIYEESKNKSPIWPQNITFGYTKEGGSTPTYFFGAKTEGLGFNQSMCGTVNITVADKFTQKAQVYQNAGGMNPVRLLSNLEELNPEIDKAQTKQIAATEALISSLDSIAKDFAQNPSVGSVQSRVDAATAAYEASVKDASSGIVSKLADFKQLEESATKDGWILGGAWFMRISYLMDVANQVMGKIPDASGANKPIDNIFKDQYYAKYARPLEELKSKVEGAGDFGVGTSDSQTEADGKGGWFSSVKSFVSKMIDPKEWVKQIFKTGFKFALNADDHPVVTLKNVGNFLLLSGSGMFWAYSGTLTALGTVQGTGIGFAVSTLPIAMIIFPMIIGTGFALSYVLPMMPFFIWFGVVVGWLVLCVEAMIAAPIWAVMHLTASGDDLTGSGSQGYRLLLSLLLRPVLMVFGLISAIVLITVVGKLLNMVFVDVFILSQQNSDIFVWLISFIAAPLLYLGLQWAMFKKILSVIHIIPDQLLTWFGGGGQQLGSYGESMGGHGSTTYMAAGAIGNTGGRAMDAKRNAVDLSKQTQQAAAALRGNELKIADDNGVGSGSIDVIKQGLQESGHSGGLDSLEGQQLAKNFGSAVASLGGANSSSGQAFQENMANDMKSGMSYDNAFSKNLSAGLDEKYGSGAGDFAGKQSGGKFTGSGFTGAIEQLQKAQQHYGKLGKEPSEVAGKTMGLIGAAQGKFESSKDSKANGGEKSIGHFVDSAIAKSAEKNGIAENPVVPAAVSGEINETGEDD